jgi:hypothetical protein
MAIAIQYTISKETITPGVDTGGCLQNNGSWGPYKADPKLFTSEASAATYIDENLTTGLYFIKSQVVKS